MCSGQQVLSGFNDLATVNPILASEWDYPRNVGLSPDKVSPGSKRKVWWICSRCGNEWRSSVANRSYGTGCPKCSGSVGTSFPEQAILFYLKRDGNSRLENRALIKGGDKNTYEVDVLLPEKRIGIEYDGLRWHANSQERDERKNHELCAAGIRLVRVKEGSQNLVQDDVIEYDCRSSRDVNLTWAIATLEVLLGITQQGVISPKQDSIAILELFRAHIEENSLSVQYPKIAAQWDHERNGTLNPTMFLPSSHEVVWWKCDKGHAWTSSIANRTLGNGCPYCSGRSALAGFNDLGTLYPAIASEWDYSRNGELTPSSVTVGSDKKIWWKCSRGHEWQTSVAHRVEGNGCPVCSGKRVLAGFNDLTTTNPNLALEWHPTKNGSAMPSTVTAGSSKKVWWKCPICGKEWKASVCDRTHGRGCPDCGRKRMTMAAKERASIPKPGKSLSDVFPILAMEWNSKKNGALTPSDISGHSNRKVWWICPICGHEWEARVDSRSAGAGCPNCHHRVASPDG